MRRVSYRQWCQINSSGSSRLLVKVQNGLKSSILGAHILFYIEDLGAFVSNIPLQKLYSVTLVTGVECDIRSYYRMHYLVNFKRNNK